MAVTAAPKPNAYGPDAVCRARQPVLPVMEPATPNICRRCRFVILPEGRTLCYFCERKS